MLWEKRGVLYTANYVIIRIYLNGYEKSFLACRILIYIFEAFLVGALSTYL